MWGAALVVGLGLLWAGELAPEVGGSLPPAAIRAELGLAHVAPVPVRARLPYRIRGARSDAPPAGRLVLYENGVPLGPPDALHETISREGGGAYLYWGDTLYLSSSDGTDPARNGRAYTVAGRAALDPWLRALAWGLLALAGVGWVAAVRAGRAASRSPGVVVRRAGQAGVALGALGLLGLLAVSVLVPVRSGTLEPGAMAPGPGRAYLTDLPGPPPGWRSAILADLDEEVAEVALREAGQPLGPPVAAPSAVVEAGGGSHALRGHRLVFSSSDGQDPRSSGRTYSWSLPVRVRGVAWLTAVALLLAGAALGAPRGAVGAVAGGRNAGGQVPGAWRWPARRGGLPGDLVADAAVLLFALWTVCAHAVVVAGGGLVHLIWLYAVALGLLLASRLLWRWSARGEPVSDPTPPGGAPASPPAGLWPWRAAAIAAALGIVGGFAWRPAPLLLWWSAVLLLAVGTATALRESPAVEPARVAPGSEGWLWLLGAAAVVVTLIAHRADSDDGFYVNLAVAAVEAPRQALLGGDTMHGIPGLPLFLPVYRVHTYELLNGAVAYLAGLSPIYVFHWLSAAIAALLVTLAHARLFRLLLPARWLEAAAVLVVILLAAGEANEWYGNAAFVRIWQGKSIFLFVVLPLIYVYALRFALRPGLRGWTMLAAAQIAAVGCTSTALWAAPVGALLALGSAFRPSRRALGTLLAGALASAYALAAGWLTRLSVGRLLEGSRLPGSSPDGSLAGPLLQALHTTLGDGRLLLFGVAALLAAWAVAPPGLARRFAAVVPLGALLLPLNPYAASWASANVIGPTYWRAMWAVPVPILMTLVLTAPLHLGTAWPATWRRKACLALVAAFVLLVPRQAGLGAGNFVRLDWPGLKVPPVAYRWAGLVNESVPPGSTVAVPPALAWLVVLFPRHAHPLDVKGYLWRRTEVLGRPNVEERDFLQQAAASPELVESMPGRFRDGLDRFGVRGVCLASPRRAATARAILRQAGFERTAADHAYELWVRRGTGTPPVGSAPGRTPRGAG